jgi:glycosyltransferase involved in cell wall biosynthesis
VKILWVSQNIPYPPKTGVLQRNYNLLREASRVADVYLVAVHKKNIIPSGFNLSEAKKELGKFCKAIKIVDLPIESSKYVFYLTILKSLFTKDPFSINWIKCNRMADAIKKLTDEVAFDVVHFDTISLAAYHSLADNIPKVLNHHNIESHLILRRVLLERNPLKRLYYYLEGKKLERYESRVCPQFDMNFTVSDLDKKRLTALAPNSCVDVIANGVDVEYFSPGDIQEIHGSLIMVSGMNWYPNRDAVQYMYDEIWPLLVDSYPDISWIIVGASPPQKLLDLASRDSRVTVTGFVDDVRPYLAKAQIYLCPMRDGGGTRLKILDALSMQKAIVGTTMAYEGIAVTPEKNVLVANTPSEFVSQIGRLLHDNETRQRIGKEGRQFVIKNYSWRVIGDKLNQIYSQVSSQ